LHTWLDATLREITELIKEEEKLAKQWGVKLLYSLVYPDQKGINVMREIGTVDSHKPGRDDNKTLDTLRFQLGDFLTINFVDKTQDEREKHS
jgi:histone deacetylase complex subunit SAP18